MLLVIVWLTLIDCAGFDPESHRLEVLRQEGYFLAQPYALNVAQTKKTSQRRLDLWRMYQMKFYVLMYEEDGWHLRKPLLLLSLLI